MFTQRVAGRVGGPGIPNCQAQLISIILWPSSSPSFHLPCLNINSTDVYRTPALFQSLGKALEIEK